MEPVQSFDILDLESWHLASDIPFTWLNVPLRNDDTGGPLTEINVVGLFTAIYAFLERNGKVITIEDKISGMRNLLGKMAKNWLPQDEWREAKFDSKISIQKFNNMQAYRSDIQNVF